MSDLLSSVDQRTKLAGQNRLELLLFNLGGKQDYGINVFKVKEIIEYIPLTLVPNLHPVIRGIVHMRGKTFPVFDLSSAVGYKEFEDLTKCYIIITEYNEKIQGFLVHSVNRIVNLDWQSMHKPPVGTGKDSYLTAVTQIENKLVEIIDVEKILQTVSPMNLEITAVDEKNQVMELAKGKKVIICDDSRIARKQLEKLLVSMGLEVISKEDGKEALLYLKGLIKEHGSLPEDLLMLISDIEMPEMDGYKLTTEIRSDPGLQEMHVVLHSSLSGVFNSALVFKVGANSFIAKFNPNEIASHILKSIKEKLDSWVT